MKFRCPDSASGACTETRCGRYLANPRQDGFDDNMNPLYTAACVFDGSLKYFYGLRPEPSDRSAVSDITSRQSKTIPVLERLAEVVEPEVIDPTSLVTTPSGQLPDMLQDATPMQKAQMMLQMATLKGVAKIHEDIKAVDLTANRIDERTRKEAERQKERQERRSVDKQAWEIWKDYMRGKYGVPVTKHKRSVKDLLINEQTRGLVENLGLSNEKTLKEAIRREDRRIKKKNTAKP